MKKDHLVKAALIFGGGFVLFMLLRPKEKSASASIAAGKTSFDGKKPSKEDAEIAAKAYKSALDANEPPARLTELNKELMADFNVRCYVDPKNGNVKVCDLQGSTIIEK